MKSLWVKSMGENRGRWDAGFRCPLLRFPFVLACCGVFAPPDFNGKDSFLQLICELPFFLCEMKV